MYQSGNEQSGDIWQSLCEDHTTPQTEPTSTRSWTLTANISTHACWSATFCWMLFVRRARGFCRCCSALSLTLCRSRSWQRAANCTSQKPAGLNFAHVKCRDISQTLLHHHCKTLSVWHITALAPQRIPDNSGSSGMASVMWPPAKRCMQDCWPGRTCCDLTLSGVCVNWHLHWLAGLQPHPYLQ